MTTSLTTVGPGPNSSRFQSCSDRATLNDVMAQTLRAHQLERAALTTPRPGADEFVEKQLTSYEDEDTSLRQQQAIPSIVIRLLARVTTFEFHVEYSHILFHDAILQVQRSARISMTVKVCFSWEHLFFTGPHDNECRAGRWATHFMPSPCQ